MFLTIKSSTAMSTSMMSSLEGCDGDGDGDLTQCGDGDGVLTQCGECQSEELQKGPKAEFQGLGCLIIITNNVLDDDEDQNNDNDDDDYEDPAFDQTIWHLGLYEFENVSYVLVDIVVFHSIPVKILAYFMFDGGYF